MSQNFDDDLKKMNRVLAEKVRSIEEKLDQLTCKLDAINNVNDDVSAAKSSTEELLESVQELVNRQVTNLFLALRYPAEDQTQHFRTFFEYFSTVNNPKISERQAAEQQSNSETQDKEDA